jgi:glyoxylase-like metal-dependent hydrolase (beta-lactamase superfamily II)
MPFSIAYLIEDTHGGVHIVDPGWNRDENVAAVDAALRRVSGAGSLASITVTHLHPDHIGLAERLRAIHGAGIALHRTEQDAQAAVAGWASDPSAVRADLERWGVPEDRQDEVLGYASASARPVVVADELLDDGDLLRIPGRRIRALHTPGHTPGHLCFVDERDGLLFTGDHILPTVVPGVGLGGPTSDNPLESYLTSLAGMRAFDEFEALPGHGFRFRGVAARSAVIARQHLSRTAEVAAVLREDPAATVWELASRLTWSRGWENLTRHYLVSALRQTGMHARLVREEAHLTLAAVWGEDVLTPDR